MIANVEYHCTLARPPATDGAPGFKRSTPAGARLPLRPARLQARTKRSVRVIKRGKHIYFSLRAGHSTAIAPSITGPGDWQGTVEATVDTSKHVNGGCRALNPAGTDWECYIGRTAVAQKIISQGFLGQYAPAPGVG